MLLIRNMDRFPHHRCAAPFGLFFLGPPCSGRRTHAGRNVALRVGSESSGGRHIKMKRSSFYLTRSSSWCSNIETVFIYPWAVQFRSLGWFLFEMSAFSRWCGRPDVRLAKRPPSGKAEGVSLPGELARYQRESKETYGRAL